MMNSLKEQQGSEVENAGGHREGFCFDLMLREVLMEVKFKFCSKDEE